LRPARGNQRRIRRGLVVGLPGPARAQQIIFNRYSLVVVDTKQKMETSAICA